MDKNRDRVDVAFVQHAEDDVDGDERGENQDAAHSAARPERSGGALERGLNAERHADVFLRLVDGFGGFAEGSVRSEIEGNGDDRELSLVIDRERRGTRFKVSDRAERNGGAVHAQRPQRDSRSRRWRRRCCSRWGLAMPPLPLLPDAVMTEVEDGGQVRIRERGADVNVVQLRRILLELRHGFENDVVLIELGVKRRDLTLAEPVVERLVDDLGVMPRRDAVTRSMTSAAARPSFCWSVATSRSSGICCSLATSLAVHWLSSF